MAKTSLICVAIIICALPACALAGEPDASKETVLKLLADIEKQAAAIKDDQYRVQTLGQVAGLYIKADCAEKAKAIAASLDESEADRVLVSIAEAQNSQNDLDAAIKTAFSIKDDKDRWFALYTIAANRAMDPKAAIKLAETLPPDWRGHTYSEITKGQILSGKFNDAAKTASLATNTEAKKKLESLVLAGRILAKDGDLAKAITDAGTTIDNIDIYLSSLAIEKAKRGNIAPARKVIGVSKNSATRAQLYSYIADQMLARRDRKEFTKAAEAAIAELADGSETIHDTMSRSLTYVHVAFTYAKAGNVEQAIKLVELAEKRGNEDFSKAQDDETEPYRIIADTGGKRPITVNIYLEAGQLDKALAAAKQEDGTIAKDILPALVYEFTKAGQEDKAVELINKAPANDRLELQIRRVGALLERLDKKDKK